MTIPVKKPAAAAVLCAILLWAAVPGAFGAEYRQLRAVIDSRSTFSDGEYSVTGLANLAAQKGLDVLVVNDHDLMRLEYGAPPFRNIFKKTVERNSIIKAGVDSYLQAVREAEKNSGLLVIAGTESAPFYYWSGNPLTGSLTAHNHEKRLLTIGLDDPDTYRNLPLPHLKSDPRIPDFSPRAAVLIAAVVLGCVMLWWRGMYLKIGILIIILGGLALYDGFFRNTSPYDPYHGNQGIAPYQHFIDHVGARGGLTFWNYPETRSGVRKLGPIQVSTLPYPEVILDSTNYTGFAALYGDTITLTEPGGLWDMALKEYCRGMRAKPPWGIATGDFHKESGDSRLGDFQTVLLVTEKTKDAVLSALKNGNMYAVQGRFPRVPMIDEFKITGEDPEHATICGQSIVVKGNPRIRLAVSGKELEKKRALIRLIRNGRIIRTFDGELPALIEFEDNDVQPGESVYYRMDMKGEGSIVSNPIFVKKESAPPSY